MGRPRRVLAWMALIALSITAVVMLQRRGAGPATTEVIAASPQPSVASETLLIRERPPAESLPAATRSRDEPPSNCAPVVSAAARFAELERGGPEEELTEQAEQQLFLETRMAQGVLSASADSEHFLAALLLEPPVPQAPATPATLGKLVELADRAAKSGSKLAAWHALRACAAEKSSCPIAHLEKRLLEIDSQNAEAWALVATLRYKRGDSSGALAAMQGAASAGTSTWYWTETVALVESALSGHSAMSYPARISSAFGSAAAYLPGDRDLMAMCKAESPTNRGWGEACLALGELRVKHNHTELGRSIAHLIREQAYTALGDSERAAEAAAELELVRAERSLLASEPASSMISLQWELVQADPSKLHSYLRAIRQYGELAGGRMFLRQEIPGLLERAALLDREGVRECAAQLFTGPSAAPTRQPARIDDQLHIDMRDRSGSGGQRIVRVGADGRIAVPFVRQKEISGAPGDEADREILAAGKTAAQLQREITTILSAYRQSPQVRVILFSPPSAEDLRREFDSARREAADRRSD